jgi:hypothetical protein
MRWFINHNLRSGGVDHALTHQIKIYKVQPHRADRDRSHILMSEHNLPGLLVGDPGIAPCIAGQF